MRCFLVFFLSVSIVKSLDLTHEEYKRYWQEWKSFYGKSYESDILDKAHFAVWKNNLQVSRFYSSKIIGNLSFDSSRVGFSPPQHEGNARNRIGNRAT